MRRNFFYQPGLDISNPKACFEYIHDHFKYDTLSSWNGLKSIANNVKIYRLDLTGDCWTALKFLEDDGYYEINRMILRWEKEHSNYKVGFNGRSAGYLVLYNAANNNSVIPDEFNYNSWEDLKADFKYYGYRIYDYAYALRELACTVRDFDKLCDEIREYVNDLSLQNFNAQKLEELVDLFNDTYSADIDILSEAIAVSELSIENGKVDLNNLSESAALTDAWWTVVRENGLTKDDYRLTDGIFELR